MLAEAYGPVVLKPKGGTWRSRKDGGRRLPVRLRRAPLDLLNWYLGEPVGGRRHRARPVFSREIDDEVYSTLYFPDGKSGADLGQLVGRVLSQDDDPDHDLGHDGTDLRRPPGDPGLPPRRRGLPTATSPAGTSATPPS